jgi:DNA-binding FadR family transcriptional regulator
MASVPLTRVRTAYEQVADQLREQIFSGALATGQRLPRELDLAEQLGVSRPTVREALRVLASENLIRTAKGPTGGSFVMRPTVDHISDFLTANINLLTAANEVTLDELLELRESLEVPSVRLACRRRTDEDLQRLHGTVPHEGAELTTSARFRLNKDFHVTLVEAAGNKLVVLAAQPIFVVLQTHLRRTVLSSADHGVIHDGHVRLAAAIEERDEERAEAEMRQHLADLRPLYERAWRTTREALKSG